MKMMKTILGVLAITVTLTCGADQQKFYYTTHYVVPCVRWLAEKLAAGTALDRAMAFPTGPNIEQLNGLRTLNSKKRPSLGEET